jgi:hypothetical protein
VRVIASSWSDNPNKGGDVLRWLDRNLDGERYELTFAGRTDEVFERTRTSARSRRRPLAAELRRNDVYLREPQRTVLEWPCSEALASGCRVFRASGGHPELVGRRASRSTSPRGPEPWIGSSRAGRAAGGDPRDPIAEVADRYLEVLRG